MRYSIKIFLLLFVALASFVSLPVRAQLISPGKLSRAHADLEGITNCTSCHVLGQRSADNNHCLDCHVPLQNRITANRGYHATLTDQNCADCHKEHFGVEFIPVRFDTLSFDHNETGFELTGSHEEATCRGCHQPENILAADVRSFKGEHQALDKTYLGLMDSCIGCHNDESPHEEQFPDTECNTCHDSDVWEEAPIFNHDNTRFELIGKHQDVSCDGCHPSVRSPGGIGYVQYTNLQFSNCGSCHEDEHQGAFGSDCASCHSPIDWNRLSQTLSRSNFDHESTGFSLIGAHAQADCGSCHGKPARSDQEIRIAFIGSTSRNSFPKVASETCLSCHVDYHGGELVEAKGGAVCENCHDQHDWYPTSYDIERHNRESSFELTGAHMATPCLGCHKPDEAPLTFDIAETECQDCHEDDNPHGIQFAEADQVTVCSTCHVTETWDQASAAFDHDQTDFPLTGKHASIVCQDCHIEQSLAPGQLTQVFRGLESTCESCHINENPHQEQFPGTACAECHNTDAFTIADFDHEKTRFPLTGAHIGTECASCHKEEFPPNQEPFTRFRPLGRECEDCHGEE